MAGKPRRLAVAQRDRFQQLQALDDAIAWRQARIAASCPGCQPGPDGRRCGDHACDLDLIAAYRQMAAATIRHLSEPASQLSVAGGVSGSRDIACQGL
ncbi:MAG TPA: hypothetical protein VMV92_28905 [Streptosporangiaceae bacterium]|nr:hypothetical protein [Streptosporangiaceae bacterium]